MRDFWNGGGAAANEERERKRERRREGERILYCPFAAAAAAAAPGEKANYLRDGHESRRARQFPEIGAASWPNGMMEKIQITRASASGDGN